MELKWMNAKCYFWGPEPMWKCLEVDDFQLKIKTLKKETEKAVICCHRSLILAGKCSTEDFLVRGKYFYDYDGMWTHVTLSGVWPFLAENGSFNESMKKVELFKVLFELTMQIRNQIVSVITFSTGKTLHVIK